MNPRDEKLSADEMADLKEEIAAFNSKVVCLRCGSSDADLLRPTDDERFICDACAFDLSDEEGEELE